MDSGKLDIGIIIALAEEFRVLFADIADAQPVNDSQTGRSYFIFERNGLRCGAVLIGEMGEQTNLFSAMDRSGKYVKIGIDGKPLSYHPSIQ